MDTEKKETVETQATTKLKKGDIVERFNLLSQEDLNLEGRKLLYAIDRNLTKLAALAHSGDAEKRISPKDLSFEKRYPESAKFKKLYLQRVNDNSQDIFKEFSKDKDGNPKTKLVNNKKTGEPLEVFDTDPTNPKLLKALNDATTNLDAEFEDEIKKLKADQEEYIDFLNEDFEEEISFLKVSLDEVNENVKRRDMEAISWMIKDE